MTASAPTERQLEVAIYAARTTDKAAAEHYGMPRRTVTNVRNRWQDTPEFRIARARLAFKVADQYAEIEQLAIDRARIALLDPNTPARDVARFLEVSAQNRALASGDATSRNESYVVSEERARETADLETHAAFLRAIVDASDDERRQYLAEHGIDVLRNIAGDADVR